MPIINPDTSDMADMGPIASGTYPAKVIAVESKPSKAGNPMIEVTFEVNVGDGKTRQRKGYCVLTGAGAFNFDQVLRATGFGTLADQYADKNVSPKPQFDTDELIGQELNVVIEPNLYQGEMRDQIKSYLPV